MAQMRECFGVTDETLNVGWRRTDDRNMTFSPAADPTASSWTSFVERFGVTACVGLLAVIPTIASAIADPAAVPDGLPALRLSALLIAVAAMAVLAWRESRTPALVPIPVPAAIRR